MTQLTHNKQEATHPPLYGEGGNMDIRARREAIKARMKQTNTGEEIWNHRMGNK